jgi:hypothetical protein
MCTTTVLQGGYVLGHILIICGEIKTRDVYLDVFKALAGFIEVSIRVFLWKEVWRFTIAAFHVIARKRSAIASWAPNVSLDHLPHPTCRILVRAFLFRVALYVFCVSLAMTAGFLCEPSYRLCFVPRFCAHQA